MIQGTDMASGTVKFYNPDKGFGFIKPDQGGDDVFVHVSELQRSGLADVKEGERLSYDLVDGRNGRKAAGNLRPA